MNYRQIETSREVRLWATQIILPAVGMATAILIAKPELAKNISKNFKNLKNNVKNFFTK